jgi:hypothetical protein
MKVADLMGIGKGIIMGNGMGQIPREKSMHANDAIECIWCDYVEGRDGMNFFTLIFQIQYAFLLEEVDLALQVNGQLQRMETPKQPHDLKFNY